MKKLTASLIALALCAFTSMAQAWHTEKYIDDDGCECVRIIEDEWEKTPAKEVNHIVVDSKENTQKPVDKLIIEREENGFTITDESNSRRWRCDQFFDRTICHRVGS